MSSEKIVLGVLGVTSWQNLVFLTKFWPNGNHRSRARSRPRQRPRQRLPITALLELFFVTVDVAVVVDVHVNVAVDSFSFGCGFVTLGPCWLKLLVQKTSCDPFVSR